MSSSTPGSNPGSSSSSPSSSPEKKQLRKPHAATQARLRTGIQDQNQNSQTTVDPQSQSTLSANAPEFVPSFRHVPSTSVQMASTLSVTAPVFTPRNVPTSYQDGSQEPLYEEFQRLVSLQPSHITGVPSTVKDQSAEKFKYAIVALTTSPGNVEEYLKPVIDSLSHVTDQAVLDEVIECLFEQSVREANFRYTGARICKYLSNELKTHQVFSNFRGLFLKRCQSEYKKSGSMLCSPDSISRLCGLTMFFGELFLVLEIETATGSQKIILLINAIKELVSTLLSVPDDVTVKCACQVLKLTGAAIQDATSKDGSFDEIYARLQELHDMPSLNKTSELLIKSVLTQRESNWGRGAGSASPQKPQSVPMATAYPPNYVAVNEPVFFNAMGQQISREEAGLYQESEYDGLTFEEQEAFEQEAYLQWEAQNNFADNRWTNETESQNFINNQWNGHPAYTRWSSNASDQAFEYSNGDYRYGGEEYGGTGGEYGGDGDMDEEMLAAYEEFLQSNQQNIH